MNSGFYGNRGIDWDGELQALMEAGGIDPAELVCPPWTTRIRQHVRSARTAVATAAVVVPVAWEAATAGAPTAASVPLIVWLHGWIGYAGWICAGRPDLPTVAAHARTGAVAALWAGSRLVHAATRPVRVGVRARRLAAARAVTATAGVQ